MSGTCRALCFDDEDFKGAEGVPFLGVEHHGHRHTMLPFAFLLLSRDEYLTGGGKATNPRFVNVLGKEFKSFLDKYGVWNNNIVYGAQASGAATGAIDE